MFLFVLYHLHSWFYKPFKNTLFIEFTDLSPLSFGWHNFFCFCVCLNCVVLSFPLDVSSFISVCFYLFHPLGFFFLPLYWLSLLTAVHFFKKRLNCNTKWLISDWIWLINGWLLMLAIEQFVLETFPNPCSVNSNIWNNLQFWANFSPFLSFDGAFSRIVLEIWLD